MFDRMPKRLDDRSVVMAALKSLHDAGFDRARVEEALIRQAPVDLDLLADCYAILLEEGEITEVDQAAA